VHAE